MDMKGKNAIDGALIILKGESMISYWIANTAKKFTAR
jgi:hypothetical protein